MLISGGDNYVTYAFVLPNKAIAIKSEIMKKYAFQTHIQFAQNARIIERLYVSGHPWKTHCLPIWSWWKPVRFIVRKLECYLGFPIEKEEN